MRRLTTVLAADVDGYSRLMTANEKGVLRRLRALHADLIEPCIAKHNGRIINATGDGLLVEFVNVIDAVRCATAWQSGMMARDPGAADGNHIEFRIGIHLGEVNLVEGDTRSEHVSATACHETRAEPGAIYISAAAYEQVRDELEIEVGRAAVGGSGADIAALHASLRMPREHGIIGGMMHAEGSSGHTIERRVAVRMRAMIDLAITELRRLGAADEEIQAYLDRKRAQFSGA
jgi:class 3 adenylate cyclase